MTNILGFYAPKNLSRLSDIQTYQSPKFASVMPRKEKVEH